MTIQTSSTPAVAGRLLPTPGRWSIDPIHSRVGFAVRHAAIATVRGQFTDVSGELVIGEPLEASTVTATIQAASFTTGTPLRDGEIRAADWLGVEEYPTITFASTALDLNGAHGFLRGDLTIREISRPITLELDYAGTAVLPVPQPHRRAGFSAAGRIDRRDFGITRNMPLPSGGFFVSYAIDVVLDIEAVAAEEHPGG